MRKRIYQYETDLNNNHFFIQLKHVVSNFNNYSIVRQNTADQNITIIGLEPKEYIYSDEYYLNIVNKSQYLNKKGDYLKHLLDWLSKTQIDSISKFSPFLGGALGFINDTVYDYYQECPVENSIPHICFMVFDEFIIVDHNHNKIIFAYIGEYKKEGLYNNRFLKMKKLFGQAKLDSIDMLNSLNFEKHNNDNKYERLIQKFSADKFFVIKTSEKITVNNDVDSYELFYTIMNKGHYEQFAIFKTNDFTAIVCSENDYIQLNKNKMQISQIQNNDIISKDILYNQISRLSCDDINHVMQDGRTTFNISVKNSLYDILNNFKLLEHNYGIPFRRNKNFIRRMESNYRFSGMIGYIGYNGNMYMIDGKNTFIKDKGELYINYFSTISNQLDHQAYEQQLEKSIEKISNIFNQ